MFHDDTPEDDSGLATFPKFPMVALLGSQALFPQNLYAFEGPDACGKSTAIREVTERLRLKNRSVVTFKLGGSELVQHALPRAKWINADPMTLNLLNWTSVYQQTTANIDLFNSAEVLFFDRYTLSIKVRGALEGIDLRWIDGLDRGVPVPKTIFVFDCPPEVCLQRIRQAGRAITYFEMGARDTTFCHDPEAALRRKGGLTTADVESSFLLHQARLREAFQKRAQEMNNVRVIDSRRALPDVVDEICGLID